MVHPFFFRRRWSFLAMILAGGALFQTTSCTAVAANVAGSVTTSVLNEYISSAVSEWLGLGPSLSF